MALALLEGEPVEEAVAAGDLDAVVLAVWLADAEPLAAPEADAAGLADVD